MDAPEPVCTCLCQLWDGLFDFLLFLPVRSKECLFFLLSFLKKNPYDGYEWPQTAESSLEICHSDTY